MYLKKNGNHLEFRDGYTGGEYGYIDIVNKTGHIYKTGERFSEPDTMKTLYNAMRMRVRDIEHSVKGWC